jgi:hypothetical protein
MLMAAAGKCGAERGLLCLARHHLGFLLSGEAVAWLLPFGRSLWASEDAAALFRLLADHAQLTMPPKSKSETALRLQQRVSDALDAGWLDALSERGGHPDALFEVRPAPPLRLRGFHRGPSFMHISPPPSLARSLPDCALLRGHGALLPPRAHSR